MGRTVGSRTESDAIGAGGNVHGLDEVGQAGIRRCDVLLDRLLDPRLDRLEIGLGPVAREPRHDGPEWALKGASVAQGSELSQQCTDRAPLTLGMTTRGASRPSAIPCLSVAMIASVSRGNAFSRSM
jgi:hypothetical protein